ncbi:MAG: ABC transporter permease [Acidobacteriota bacterium]
MNQSVRRRWINWERIGVLMRKELTQVWREPRLRILLVGPPLLQLIIFGYAVNLDVEDVPLAWYDQDRSPVSRELLAAFAGSEYFRVVAAPTTGSEVEHLLDAGTVNAVISVPPDFSEDVKRGRTARLQVLIDGSNSNTASMVSAYIGGVVEGFARDLLGRQAQHRLVAMGRPVELRVPQVVLERRIWFNPELQSQDYFIPGVVVNIIGIVTVMLTALAIVRERELGTLEQLIVTPIRVVELMLGKTLPFALIGLLEVSLVVSAAVLVFDMPFRGSFLVLLTGAVLFLLTTLGTGLLISTLSGTQQQAMMASFFFFLPSFMLSGFAFPIRNMPVPIQYLTLANAVRHFLELSRGVFVQGVGWSVLWPQLLALLLIGLAMLGFAVLRFHKRLD